MCNTFVCNTSIHLSNSDSEWLWKSCRFQVKWLKIHFLLFFSNIEILDQKHTCLCYRALSLWLYNTKSWSYSCNWRNCISFPCSSFPVHCSWAHGLKFVCIKNTVIFVIFSVIKLLSPSKVLLEEDMRVRLWMSTVCNFISKILRVICWWKWIIFLLDYFTGLRKQSFWMLFSKHWQKNLSSFIRVTLGG